MINPVKWLKTNSQSKLFNWVNWKLVFSFYITLFVPVLYLSNLGIAYFTPGTLNIEPSIVVLGLPMALFGLIFWIVSFINLRHSFGVLPQKQKRIKTGLYKHFNHPMYIGIYATFFGLSLSVKSLPGMFFLNIIILPLLIIRAYFEDKNLT